MGQERSYNFAMLVDDGLLIAIGAGYNHVCGLREDGAPLCWDYTEYERLSVPESEHFTIISSGEDHTCALREDGSALCWGWNDIGNRSGEMVCSRKGGH